MNLLQIYSTGTEIEEVALVDRDAYELIITNENKNGYGDGKIYGFFKALDYLDIEYDYKIIFVNEDDSWYDFCKFKREE